MSEIRLTDRYIVEWKGADEHRVVVDLFTQRPIGHFWRYDGVWVFRLDDGRSRFGGFDPVLADLKAMLRRAPYPSPEAA